MFLTMLPSRQVQNGRMKPELVKTKISRPEFIYFDLLNSISPMIFSG
jgi:hypothetical protein